MALFTFIEYHNADDFINHHGFKRNVNNLLFVGTEKEENGTKQLPKIEEVFNTNPRSSIILKIFSVTLSFKESKWLQSEMFKATPAQIGRMIGKIFEIIISKNNIFCFRWQSDSFICSFVCNHILVCGNCKLFWFNGTVCLIIFD